MYDVVLIITTYNFLIKFIECVALLFCFHMKLNKIDHYNFLHALIPKIKRKYINYTKKKKKDKEVYERVCSVYELSQREVDLYSENFKINIKKYE